MSDLTKFKQVYDRSLHQYVLIQDEDGDHYLVDDVDAELQRHKRAIEWCLNNAARRARDDNGERCIMNADYDDVLSPPSDIADLVKGEK